MITFNLVEKIIAHRYDYKGIRFYADGEVEHDKRVYRPSVTSITASLPRGIGWDKWLGNSPSFELAMKYADERAFIGTMTHILIEKLLKDGYVAWKDNYVDEDSLEVFTIPLNCPSSTSTP